MLVDIILRRMCKRISFIVAVVLLIAAGLLPAADQPTTRQAEKEKAKSENRTARIDEMYDYYAKLYRQPLEQKSRFARLIGIISLSRIDGPPITRAILSVANDPDVVVSQIAWEALHARQGSLQGEGRAAWLDGGLDAAKRGAFPGQTVAPLLAALGERPAEGQKNLTEVLIRVAETNDPATDTGKIALDAAKGSIAGWQDPKLVRALVAKMSGRSKKSVAIAHMLSGLPNAPALSSDPAAMESAWNNYERDMKLTAATSPPAYTGYSKVFPKAEEITDPYDPRWRKDLELTKLKVETVEIVYCIDATPSMAVSSPYVAAYVDTISRLFGMLDYHVRSGVVYYRHEINPDLMDECCKKWNKYPDDFAVKTFPLTDKPSELVGKMKAMKIQPRGTGHSGNGAYVAGLTTAVSKISWSPKSKRIIALTGDAKPTPGSEKALVEAAKRAIADNYMVVFIQRGIFSKKTEKWFPAKDMDEFSMEATGQKSIMYGPDIDKVQKLGEAGNTAAVAEFEGTAFEEMSVRVLEQSLPEGYRDRVRPLVDAIVPILQARTTAMGK